MRHQLDDQSCRASLLSLSPVSRSDPPSSVWRLPVALLHLGSSTATPSCWCVCSSSPYPPSCERRPCTTAVALLATNTTTLSARHLSEELLSQNFPQKRETKRKKKTLTVVVVVVKRAVLTLSLHPSAEAELVPP